MRQYFTSIEINDNNEYVIKHDNDYIHKTIMKSLIRNNKKRIDNDDNNSNIDFI